jgi:hypothetical protein
MKWLSTLAAVAFLGLGCGSAGSSSADSEQFDGVCPNPPTILTGTAPAGTDCDDYETCAPVCCSCNNGDGDTFLAAECDVGECDPANACADIVQDASLCP